MIRGLQAGFGSPIGDETLADLRRLGVVLLRLDCQHQSPEQVLALQTEASNHGFFTLLIVSQPQEVTMLPSGSQVEVENEPDLADTPPEAYVEKVKAICEVATPMGITVWAPVVSNLNERGLEYLASVMPMMPPEVKISVHRYPHDTFFRDGPKVPHDKFASREEEIATLRILIGDRAWGVSEFGYHTAPRKKSVGNIPIRVRQWTDFQVHQHVQWEWAFWERMDAEFAILYQINDGVDPNVANDRYGIRRVDGSWKSVAATFRPAGDGT
jgi:hypothetical protein